MSLCTELSFHTMSFFERFVSALISKTLQMFELTKEDGYFLELNALRAFTIPVIVSDGQI